MVGLVDFGLDELVLAVIAVLLLTVYRPTFRAIVAEAREAEAKRLAQSCRARDARCDRPRP